ncbi:hypothetical protein TWF281_010961 [Arthrobotrys megalospora]
MLTVKVDMKQDNAKLAERLKTETEETLKALILPDLAEIQDKLDVIHTDVRDIKSNVKDLSQEVIKLRDSTALQILENETRKRFEKHYRDLKPSDTHLRQLNLILEPLRRRLGTAHLSRWLFDHEHYKDWAHGDQRILYIKGQPGFGKSVTVALAIERLLVGVSGERLPSFERYKLHPSSATDGTSTVAPQDNGCPVIFFFFKRGDDETQLANNATSCLLAQLFHSKYATTQEEMETLIGALGPPPDDNKGDNVEHGLDQNAPGTSHTKNGVEDRPAHHGASMIHQRDQASRNIGTRDKDSSVTSDIAKLERVARAIGRTVYILIDGIDECTDYESTGLVSELIRLGKLKEPTFKILFSSRENLGLEILFEQQRKNTEPPNNTTNSTDNIHCEIRDNATILTANKSTNRDDMRAYLEESLTELLDYGFNDQMYSTAEPLQDDENKHSTHRVRLNQKQVKDIQGMVETIQNKAEGMFTYSAMVIASLRQPSQLSIKRRVKELPDQMDSLYSKHLESLTIAQRKLVILALKRIAWAPRDMNTLEIVDQFKQKYLKSEVSYFDSSDSDEDSDDPESPALRGKGKKSTMTSQIRIMEREMKKPEVIYTIRHLQEAGREFFGFSNGRDTIHVIHKSVLDWVERESRKAEELYSRQLPITDIFKLDDNGEVRITVPRFFVEGHSTSVNFQSQRETHLDTLLYILEVLTSTKFQDRYIPIYSLESLDDFALLDTDPSAFAAEGRARASRKDLIPHRGELTDLNYHMTQVSLLWPDAERSGPKWTKLHTLLRKLSHPGTFTRWSTAFLLLNYSELYEPVDPHQVITPGFLAAEFAWDIYLKFLLTDQKLNYDFGLDLHSPLFGLTILHNYGIYYRPEILEQIIIKYRPGKSLDTLRDSAGYTPFLRCLWRLGTESNPSRRKLLVASLKHMLTLDLEPNLCFNINMPDRLDTPLYYLYRSLDPSLLSLVLEKYAGDPSLLDVNHPDNNGRTPLHLLLNLPYPVSDDTQVEFAKLLLQAGADPNTQDFNSRSPLGMAVMGLREKSVELLLEYGANPNDDDTEGNVAFTLIAGRPGQSKENVAAISILRLLKKYGADITRRKKWNGLTALMEAILEGYWEGAKVILEMYNSETEPGDCSYLMQTTLSGETLLHQAVHHVATGYEIAKFVVENMNDDLVIELLETEDNSGQKAIEYAFCDDVQLADYLIDCYYHYSNKRKLKAAESDALWLPKDLVFRIFWRPEYVARYIMESIKKPNSMKPAYKALVGTQPYAAWLLGALAVGGNKELISDIISYGANPFEKDPEGWDTFDWAYAHGLSGTVEVPKIVDYNTRKEGWEKSVKIAKGWGEGHLAIKIGEDKLKICFDKDFREGNFDEAPGLVADYPVSPYTQLFYYEVTIVEFGSCDGNDFPRDAFLGVGYTIDYPNLSQMPGWSQCSESSFGLHSDDGLVYSSTLDARRIQLECGPVHFGVGDTVGCGYDQMNHTIFWTLNGRHLGIAFNNVQKRLWPIIAGRWFEIDTNFGGKEFAWKST